MVLYNNSLAEQSLTEGKIVITVANGEEHEKLMRSMVTMIRLAASSTDMRHGDSSEVVVMCDLLDALIPKGDVLEKAIGSSEPVAKFEFVDTGRG